MYFFMLLAAMLLSSISAFAQSGNSEPLKGDLNGDGKVDMADVTVLIDIILGRSGTEPVNPPEEPTYYWYVGPTTPTAVDTNDIKTSASEIGWHLIEGTPTSIHVGELYNPTKVNWVVLIPTRYNITKISNGEDVTDLYTVSIITIDGEVIKPALDKKQKENGLPVIAMSVNKKIITGIAIINIPIIKIKADLDSFFFFFFVLTSLLFISLIKYPIYSNIIYNSFSNSSSLKVFTPNSIALSNLEPASLPKIT